MNIFYKIKKNKKGLSLLEIMVAFSIIVVTFIGLMQAFPYGLSISKDGENSTIASYLCQEKIEELTSTGYDNITTGTVETKARLSDDKSSYLYYYQRETIVNYVDGSLNASLVDLGIKKISVTIYYDDVISKQNTSYNITTLIAER